MGFLDFLQPAFGHGRLGHPQSLEYILTYHGVNNSFGKLIFILHICLDCWECGGSSKGKHDGAKCWRKSELPNLNFSPLKIPIKVGSGYSFTSISAPFCTQPKMTREQATTVVMRAPTAMGQKSLGVPAQVRGIREMAVMTIHWQRCRSKPVKGILQLAAQI